MFTNFKHSLLTAGTFSLLSFSTFAVANPANAANLDLTTWQKIGDVTTTPNQAILKSGTGNTVVNDGGAGSISTFLGVSPAQLDNLAPTSFFGATQGSAIKNTFNANVGDIFSFNWNFSGETSLDKAFVTINNTVAALTVGSTFSYSFLTAGNYNIGIGVVDVDDSIGQSSLSVSNANVQPVPEPTTILGSLTALGLGTGMLRRSRKKTSV